MAETKEKETPKKEAKKMIKLPDLNQDFSGKIRAKESDSTIVFRLHIAALDRLLSLFRFAKDDKSQDLPVFYHQGSLIFLKNQLDASKSGVVPIELVEGLPEDVEYVLFNLDYSLLQQVYSTMKQIDKDTLIMEFKGSNSVEFLIGTFRLPSKLKSTVLEIPYSALDSNELTELIPVAELRKILDISYNTTDSKHSALDNIYIDNNNVIGGTRGLLLKTSSILPKLEEGKLLGFNYKFYSDIAAFSSLVSGEISVTLGSSNIRGSVREVLEFSSYDCRLVVPLSILNDGDKSTYTQLRTQLDIEDNDENTVIQCTVKSVRRTLNCMQLALYGLKSTHKTTFAIKGQKVVVSATPLTNEPAVDTLTCNVANSFESSVILGIQYLMSALDSFEADDNIEISIPKVQDSPRIKIYGKVKQGYYKSWITATYLQ
jgi:hypothetical protein